VSQPGEQELRDGGKFEFKNVLPGTYVARLIVFTFDGGKPAVQMLRLGQPIEVRNASVEDCCCNRRLEGRFGESSGSIRSRNSIGHS